MSLSLHLPRPFVLTCNVIALALCTGPVFGATLNGSATLDGTSPLFQRPGPTCLAGGSMYKFVAVDFVVDTAGAYTFDVPANGQVTDPWLQLYSSPFTASLPTANCIKGDDDSGSGLSAQIANQPLNSNQVYTAVVTTYNPAQVGNVNWSITGPGNFQRRNGFIKAQGTEDFANGNVNLALRLSSNGVDSTDDLRWVAVLPGALVPTYAEVIAGQQGGGGAAPHAGTLSGLAIGSDIASAIVGLTNGTAYDIYMTLLNGSSLATVRVLDFTPTAPVFPAINNAALSTSISSATATLSGFTEALPISIISGEYQINGGAFTSAAGTANPGDTVTLRQISAAGSGVATTATLTLGSVTASFVVTTGAQGAVSIPTLSEWGVLLLSGLMAVLGLLHRRRS